MNTPGKLAKVKHAKHYNPEAKTDAFGQKNSSKTEETK